MNDPQTTYNTERKFVQQTENTRATYSNIHSENVSSVNPDQRNRPGRTKKRTWVWTIQHDILFSLEEPHDNVLLQVYRQQQEINNNNNKNNNNTNNYQEHNINVDHI